MTAAASVLSAKNLATNNYWLAPQTIGYAITDDISSREDFCWSFEKGEALRVTKLYPGCLRIGLIKFVLKLMNLIHISCCERSQENRLSVVVILRHEVLLQINRKYFLQNEMGESQLIERCISKVEVLHMYTRASRNDCHLEVVLQQRWLYIDLS